MNDSLVKMVIYHHLLDGLYISPHGMQLANKIQGAKLNVVSKGFFVDFFPHTFCFEYSYHNKNIQVFRVFLGLQQ